MANVIERCQRPTLVLAPNRTLAAQLYSEFKEFFPDNAVEYFVSYYDYYQPEAYIPRTDTYIAKDADINEEIDKLRHAATRALFERRDVLIVASVSCIYGLGEPEEYQSFVAQLQEGRGASTARARHAPARRHAVRAQRHEPRARQVPPARRQLTIMPAYEELAVRIDFFGDEVERIIAARPADRRGAGRADEIDIYPAKHFVTSQGQARAGDRGHRGGAGGAAGRASASAASSSRRSGSRSARATTSSACARPGYCSGIENYSRHLARRAAGQHALDAARLLPRRLAAVHRRVAHRDPAGARHVPRRHRPQADARRLRLPPALGARQPAAQLRGVRGAHQPGHLRLRDARAVRARAQRAGRRADHPPDRPARPADRGAARRRARSTTCWTRSARASTAASACWSRR